MQHKIARGKVDVTVTIEHVCDTQLTVQVNESLARGYVQALKTLAQQYHLNQEIDAVSIANYPDVLTVYKEQEDEEVLWNAVQQVSETAFCHMLEMREQEGANLKQDLLRRADDIDRMVKEIEMRSPQTVEEYKQRLQARMKELFADSEYNESRLYTELILFTDKVSVAEENRPAAQSYWSTETMLESKEAVGRKIRFFGTGDEPRGKYHWFQSCGCANCLYGGRY